MTFPSVIALDLETSSPLDLQDFGVERYAAAGDIHIAAAYWEGGHRTATGKKEVDVFLRDLIACEPVIVAHHVAFERTHINEWCRRQGIEPPPLASYRCTMAFAHSMNLPASLDGLTSFLYDGDGKDTEGEKVMLEWVRNIAKGYDPECDPDVLNRLTTYCLRDAEVCWRVWRDHLSKGKPRDVGKWGQWLMSARINERGLPVDIGELDRVSSEVATALDEIYESLRDMIGDEPKPSKFRAWLAKELDCDVPTAKGEELLLLVDGLPADHPARIAVRAFVALRGRATDKWAKARDWAVSDGSIGTEGRSHRLRHGYTYRGAFTGRYKSKGVQLHNFKRARIGGINSTDDLRLVSGMGLEEMCLFVEKAGSACRSMVSAPDGWTFFQGDYSQVEMRIAMWLAGETDVFKKLEDGVDLYRDLAGRIYGRSPADVSDDERFVGKTAMLGLQYGMGKKKFAFNLANGERRVPDAKRHAEAAFRAYHETYKGIRRMHNALEGLCTRWEGRVGSVSSRKAEPFGDGKKAAILRLPTGSTRIYWNPDLQSYTSYETGKPQSESLYGGKFMEHICSGIASDLLIYALADLESYVVREGQPDVRIPCGHTHDSVLVEIRDDDDGAIRAESCAAIMESVASRRDMLDGLRLDVDWKLDGVWK